MLYLAFIFHMHQPYYRNLLTGECPLPWVRLHGTKDYLDMVEGLKEYPAMHVTFNLVPSLLEQIESYAEVGASDTFLELSYKPAKELTDEDKAFISAHFFSINPERVIALSPRYYELYFKMQGKKGFDLQDYLDLQVWFNLAWVDPVFRQENKLLRDLVNKGRFYTEEEKAAVLDTHKKLLERIIPAYKKFQDSGQIELTASPFYHPILPLLHSTNVAKEANTKTVLPRRKFSYPQDAVAQIELALNFFKTRFTKAPLGMWPSEEAVSEHIVPLLIQSGVRWIVADEAILFRSLKKRKRDTKLLYQPHLLKREEGELAIVFRDRNISDLLGFVYHTWKAEAAVNDLMKHLENISSAFENEDVLLTIAMDGENAWEYYANDGHDFLSALYQRVSAAPFVKTTTIQEYLTSHPARSTIKHLAAGSWIYGEFGKWIGNPLKARAWECLAEAREALDSAKEKLEPQEWEKALKQMYILEGSDWFWWYGEDYTQSFDALFRMHLKNFYTFIKMPPPQYLFRALEP